MHSNSVHVYLHLTDIKLATQQQKYLEIQSKILKHYQLRSVWVVKRQKPIVLRNRDRLQNDRGDANYDAYENEFSQEDSEVKKDKKDKVQRKKLTLITERICPSCPIWRLCCWQLQKRLLEI